MNKRKIIIITIFIIVILFFIVIIFIKTGMKKISESLDTKPTPVLSTPLPSLAKEEKTEISGVEVNNIYKNPVRTNKRGDTIFFKNDNYEFTYLPKFNKFMITIIDSPFLSWVEKAENDFVRSLGVSKNNACKFNVEVTTVLFVNPKYAGKTFPLSFCKNDQ